MISESVSATSYQATEGSLSHRAGRTFASSMLRQGAQFLVSFIALPIVVGGLGAELYGAWAMIQQTTGYLAQSDLRAMGTLKFSLAVRQHLNDFQQKRRLIGAALLVWAGLLPLMLVISSVIVWATPSIIRVTEAHTGAVRFAMALTVLAVAADRLLSVPANVLRGMNLEYKAMGLYPVVIILGGILSIVAVQMGLGLPGVAAANLIGIVIAHGVRFPIAKRALPWFGAAVPKRRELLSFTKLSGWLFASSIGGLLLNASALLLVGIILGPTAAAVYAMTGAAMRLAMGPIGKLLSSGGPGMAELAGRGEQSRVERARTELHLIVFIVMAVVGAGVLVLNGSFLGLWVGEELYAGEVTNLILVLVAIVTAIIRVDAVIVDSMLEFRPKALAMLAAGGVVVIIGGSMSYIWGLAGMAFGALVGNLCLVLYFQYLLMRRGVMTPGPYLRGIVRPVGAMCLILLGSHILVHDLRPDTWISFFSIASLLALTAGLLMWALGLRADDRDRLKDRFLEALPRGRKPPTVGQETSLDEVISG